MIYDVYNTTVCQSYELTHIKHNLQKDIITNEGIVTYETDRGVLKPLKLLVDPSSVIMPFSHPILIDGDDTTIVVDVRRLIRLNSRSYSDYIITNRPEYELLILQARLMLVSILDDYQKIRDFDSLPSILFARWITNSISYRLGLNPSEENVITIIASVYYINTLSEDFDPTKLSMVISRNTYIDAAFTVDIVAQCEQLTSLTALIDHMKKLISNVRMEKMTIALLLSSLTYGWRGSAAKETMGICLEHPPTWVACLSKAISERSYKDSPIAKVAKHYVKGKRDLEFISRLYTLLTHSEIVTDK